MGVQVHGRWLVLAPPGTAAYRSRGAGRNARPHASVAVQCRHSCCREPSRPSHYSDFQSWTAPSRRVFFRNWGLLGGWQDSLPPSFSRERKRSAPRFNSLISSAGGNKSIEARPGRVRRRAFFMGTLPLSQSKLYGRVPTFSHSIGWSREVPIMNRWFEIGREYRAGLALAAVIAALGWLIQPPDAAKDRQSIFIASLDSPGAVANGPCGESRLIPSR